MTNRKEAVLQGSMWLLKKTRLLVLAMSVLISTVAVAQGTPVRFSVQQKQVSPTEVDVVFSAKIDKGWHVYSTGLPDDGPVPATITIEKKEGAQPVGKLTPQGHEVNTYDEMFGMKLRFFENSVRFVQKFKITGKTYNIKGYLQYGACNDEMCLPPTQVEFNYSGKGPEDAPVAKEEEEAVKEEVPETKATADSMKN